LLCFCSMERRKMKLKIKREIPSNESKNIMCRIHQNREAVAMRPSFFKDCKPWPICDRCKHEYIDVIEKVLGPLLPLETILEKDQITEKEEIKDELELRTNSPSM
jgi:hypothetical protein